MARAVFFFAFVLLLLCLSNVRSDEADELSSEAEMIHSLSKRGVRGFSRLSRPPASSSRRHTLSRLSPQRNYGIKPAVNKNKRRYDTAKKTFSRLKAQFLNLKSTKFSKLGRRVSTKGTWAKGKKSPCGIVSAQYPNGYPCQDNVPEADIVFVMDSSGSIGPLNFKLQKMFVKQLIQHFSIPMPQTRVAAVSYSSHVREDFNFNRCSNVNSFAQEVNKITYMSRMTATGTALEHVNNNLIFNQAAGARPNVAKIVFVLTDGHSNRGTTPGKPAQLLKDKEVVIFVVGISAGTNTKELKSIASTPVVAGEQFVFSLENYAALQDIIKMLKSL